MLPTKHHYREHETCIIQEISPFFNWETRPVMDSWGDPKRWFSTWWSHERPELDWLIGYRDATKRMDCDNAMKNLRAWEAALNEKLAERKDSVVFFLLRQNFCLSQIWGCFWDPKWQQQWMRLIETRTCMWQNLHCKVCWAAGFRRSNWWMTQSFLLRSGSDPQIWSSWLGSDELVVRSRRSIGFNKQIGI